MSLSACQPLLAIPAFSALEPFSLSFSLNFPSRHIRFVVSLHILPAKGKCPEPLFCMFVITISHPPHGIIPHSGPDLQTTFFLNRSPVSARIDSETTKWGGYIYPSHRVVLSSPFQCLRPTTPFQDLKTQRKPLPVVGKVYGIHALGSFRGHWTGRLPVEGRTTKLRGLLRGGFVAAEKLRQGRCPRAASSISCCSCDSSLFFAWAVRGLLLDVAGVTLRLSSVRLL